MANHAGRRQRGGKAEEKTEVKKEEVKEKTSKKGGK